MRTAEIADDTAQPEHFRDLNLDQVVAAVTRGRDEYLLQPFFHVPLHDLDTISYRHDVFRDLETSATLGAVEAFAKAMRELREQVGRLKELHHRERRQLWLLEAAVIYCDGVTALARALAGLDLSSRGLQVLGGYLADHTASGAFTGLTGEIEALQAGVAGICYATLIRGDTVTVRRYADEADYSAAIERTFEKFKRGAVKDYRAQFPDDLRLSHVEEAVLERVARLYPEVFGPLTGFVERHADFVDPVIGTFDREIQFYLAWVEHMARLRRNGLSFCYPTLSRDKAVLSVDGFDVAFAHKLTGEGTAVVTNGLQLDGAERIIVVSGPNQGGKTPFARAFGQLNYLASLGLPVPGTEARLFLFDRLFAQFEREESFANLRGKLEDDLVRIHEILERATPDSIIVLNEIFNSTTLEDQILPQHQGVRADHGARRALRLRQLHRRAGDAEREDRQHGQHRGARTARGPHVQGPAPTRRRPRLCDVARGTARRHRRPPAGKARIMKAFLLYPDRDFDPEQPLLANHGDLTQDLELEVLFETMAGKDKVLREVARQVVLTAAENDDRTILYRQTSCATASTTPTPSGRFYGLTGATLEQARKHSFGFMHYPASILNSSVEILAIFVQALRQLRGIARECGGSFASEGFTQLFATLERELDDAYFAEVEAHLKQLRFREGVLISARLGQGGKAESYVLREPQELDRNWLRRLLADRPPSFTYRLHPRDEAGARAFSELNDRGINLVANAVAQSADHVSSYFHQIRAELAFYLGCVNLRGALARIGAPTVFPEPAPAGEPGFACRGLADVALALRKHRPAVGNDIDAGGRRLVIVTGANRGGKSTFLRSLGLAQLMLQAGMFVGAGAFRSAPCDGLFTHFKREEDATMESGKFDEELARMSGIVDTLTPHPMILFNESFDSTNEREGSEVAGQIVSALLGHGVRVVFVTHLYDFAHRFYRQAAGDALFLRADRSEDGARSFQLHQGAPLATSYGPDLDAKVFGSAAPDPATPAVAGRSGGGDGRWDAAAADPS